MNGRTAIISAFVFYAGMLVGLYLGVIAGKSAEALSINITSTAVVGVPFLMVVVGCVVWALRLHK